MTQPDSPAQPAPGTPAPAAGERFARSAAQQRDVAWMTRIPLSIALYGTPKLGKTTDILFAFPERTLWFADAQALWPSLGVVGWAPARDNVVQVTTLTDAVNALKKLGGKAGVYDAIVFDDTSLMAKATILALQAATTNKYDAWSKLDSLFGELISLARAMKAHIVFSGHEAPADPEKGRPMGTFQLPSYQLALSLPAICSMVFRVVRDPLRSDPPAAYAGPTDPSSRGWVVGDRTGILRSANLPVNLAELLRATGYDIRRPAQWHDAIEKAVTDACAAVEQGYAPAEVGGYYVRQGVAEGWTEHMLQWFVRDFRDRRQIRNQPSRLHGMLQALY